MAAASFVKEEAEILKLLDVKAFAANTAAPEKLGKILEKYQENPELLDGHLEPIITSLMATILPKMKLETKGEKTSQNSTVSATYTGDAVMHRAWRVIYYLCKTRGYKTVTKFFPHKVSHLESVVNLLVSQDQNDYKTWHTRYGLLLWLSLLVLLPFDLRSLDSNFGQILSKQKDGKLKDLEERLSQRLVKIGQRYLSDTGTTREAAAFFLAKLFTRRDLQDSGYLRSFCVWAKNKLEALKTDNDPKSVFFTGGVLLALAQILKLVPRKSLKLALPVITSAVIQNSTWLKSRSGILRKLATKVTQRAALAILPVKLATWRYRRGRRILLENLKEKEEKQRKEMSAISNVKEIKEKMSEEKKEVPEWEQYDEKYVDFDEEVIEDAIEILLVGLSDRETIVRWSAAKGIGRITSRLPKCHGDDVVMAVLELISPSEPYTSWHGACLAIAEMGRRGLILPNRLPLVLPKTLQALDYDQRQGSNSVGANVRDSACYVAWAFARAYAPEVFKPFVMMLAQGLISTACYDREVNVRRAGAAAYQEHVGRQGTFPHGIEVNTTADYFSLANKQRSFVEISTKIGKFSEYRASLIDHLVLLKSRHWDKNVRELTARSLQKFSKITPEYLAEIVLPTLAKRAKEAFDVEERHGAILSVAKIILGINEYEDDASTSTSSNTKVYIHEDSKGIHAALSLLPTFHKSNHLMGKGGILIREALSELIRSLSLSKAFFSSKDSKAPDFVDLAVDMLLDNLRSSAFELQQLAALAITPLSENYQGHKRISEDLQAYLVSILSRDALAQVRRGAALALGSLPKSLLVKNLSNLVLSLTMAGNDVGEKDPETRREAINALTSICQEVVEPTSANNASPSSLNIRIAPILLSPISPFRPKRLIGHTIFNALIKALSDYAIDRRGDVGSWVREAAIRGLDTVVPILSNTNQILLKSPVADGSKKTAVLVWTSKMGLKLTAALIKQMGEKIARIRKVAGQVYAHLIGTTIDTKENYLITNIPCREKLLDVIQRANEEQKQFESKIIDNLPKTLGKEKKSNSETKTTPAEMKLIKANWARARTVFPALVTLLETDKSNVEESTRVRQAMMSGLVLSAGSRTKSLSEAAVGSLTNWVTSSSRAEGLAEDFIWLFNNYSGERRVTKNLFRALGDLLSKEAFELLKIEKKAQLESMGMRICTLVGREMKNSSDVNLLLGGVRVFLGILAFGGDAAEAAMRRCLDALEHKYPRVRNVAAEELYESVLLLEEQYEYLGEEKYEQILETLSETSWDAPIREVIESVDKLLEIFEFPSPEREHLKAEDKKEKPDAKTTAPSYLDLVKEMGF